MTQAEWGDILVDALYETSKNARKDMSFLLLEFPAHKDQISKLNYDRKMEWYAHQFTKRPGVYPTELTTNEFKQFWKWRVLIPMKIRRSYYRLKNGEMFKKYPSIMEFKKKKE